MAYGKFKMGSKRTITGPQKPGSGDGDGRVYAGGPGWRELNNLGPKTPGGRVTIMPVKPKPGSTLPPIRRKGPGGGPKPRAPRPGSKRSIKLGLESRKERQLPTRVKPQGQRRKASDMGKTAQNGRPRIRGGR